MPVFTRRRLLYITAAAVPAACLVDTLLVEPEWLKVTRLVLSDRASTRLVHFSDLHYKGDRPFLAKVVKRINEFSPDFVCFTGDIVENKKHLPEALDILTGLQKPLYGVPGNHDYWSQAPFDEIERCFRSTGGDWLVDSETMTKEGLFRLEGASGEKFNLHSKESRYLTPGGGLKPARATAISTAPAVSDPLAGDDEPKRILLTHYPVLVKKLGGGRRDLILAGHSHGGQIRLPGLGALLVPNGVEEYERGFYRTRLGPLYVNQGIGTFLLSVRFFCRPEITVIEI